MNGSFGAEHWPLEIRHKQQERELEIEFDDGAVFTLPAELLRVESPSAEVQGHGPSQKKLIAGRSGVDGIAVNHKDVLADPLQEATRINQFLGGRLDIERMAAAVDQQLYRTRRTS